MRISNEVVQQIQQSADIVEVVGDFVTLKKRGQNLMACCPFHNEKTPSFSVSPAKGIYKCFGCGKSGDSVKFVMDIEGVSYVEALRYLGKKYGIEIEEQAAPTDTQLQQQHEKDSLYIVLNYAKNYYQNLLWQSDEGQAVGLSYFKERGFKDNTIKDFELGYSTDAWDHFTKDAISKGYQQEILEKAGLLIRKEEKQFDRFRGRVIFPIHNVSGKVIAFGARILKADKNQPKYLNSPETEVYHKSNILYGMFQAKTAIRNEDTCFLVEGYTDVISLHQAGINNVVASSGTSLTLEQIRLIGRFTQNVTVLYDGDAAGIKASLRGTDMILEEGLNVKVVVFPDGNDPDSYVRQIGATAFKEFIRQHSKDFITFKTELYLVEAANDPFKKAGIIKEIVESITKIPDPIKRAVFFRQTANLLQMDEGTLIVESNQILKKQQADKEKKGKMAKTQSASNPPSPPPLVYDLPEGIMPPPELDLEEPVEFQEPKKNPIVYQEQESIRLLISYADQPIDEHNKLCNYLLAEIEGIEFQTPIYNRILDIFRAQLQMGHIVGTEYFIRHWDADIQAEAINLISQKYQLSENWLDKFQIFIPQEKDMLTHVAYSNILRLKHRIVQDKITDNMKNLAKAQSSAEQETIMRIHMQLKEIEKQIASILGNVVR
ncbi:DNA primase [Rhodocytophaga rosea]|uniref:DNA primase n=1 Tax=Rhodocytophaga rosea TaxID=2704465 RepID=A0A6C0GIV2_9BACT|nr:DNA primase [Rhodocytophaga rosea]QHT67875.1 DNA primase [Rhodocytophaga rosea]